MNYEKKPPENVLNILQMKSEVVDCSYFAWPQTFGSTAGPHPGIGGQAISSFTVEAWVNLADNTAIYVCGNMYHWTEHWKGPCTHIENWKKLPITPKDAV